MKQRLYARQFVGKYRSTRIHYYRITCPNGVGGYIEGVDQNKGSWGSHLVGCYGVGRELAGKIQGYRCNP